MLWKCHITDPCFCDVPPLPFQSATRVTIAAASGQVKTVLDVSGWQSGERGWRAKTWRNRRTREVGPSAGNGRNSETNEDELNATMIVVADHLSFRSSPLTWVTILAANRCFDLNRLPDVQVFTTSEHQLCWCHASHQQEHGYCWFSDAFSVS